jgi:phospholipase C
MRRRDALKSIGTLAGAGAASRLLAGCGDDRRPGAGGPDAGGTGADAGTPDAAPVQGLTTYVVVMMENRSYDHYLGARKLIEGLPGDGLTADMFNPDVDGTVVPIYRETDHCVADPPHGWEQSRNQMDGGANDGFLRAYRAAHEGQKLLPYVMGYFGREDIPLTWALADHYASSDRWFSSVLGPTFPNRFYLHSAQSGGRMDNRLVAADWPSFPRQLTDAGVPWTYYYSDLPFLGLFADLADVSPTNFKTFPGDFMADAAAGTLPPVTYIDAIFIQAFGNDDHPPRHPIRGQAFLASIYAALAASPQWNNTLLLNTYDEHGGFFDHVPPPKAADDRAAEGFDQLGFRVPMVAAGPYVKQGHLSSVVRDHSSVIKHLCGVFDLEPPTARAAAAADLSEIIDQQRLAALDPAPPAEVPAIELDESTIEDECNAGVMLHPNDMERLADTGFFGDLDRRAHARDIVYEIGDALERLNAGRIRRGR